MNFNEDPLSQIYFCKFCNKNTKTSILDQDLICAICGFVVEQNINMLQSQTIGDNSTLVDNTNDYSPSIAESKDYGGNYVNFNLVNSLKRTIQRSRSNTTYNRARLKGILELERIVKVMDLPVQLEEKVTSEFLRFNKEGVFRNRNIYSCIAVLISIVASSMDIPLSLTEILNNSLTTKKKFNNDYFYIYHLYDQAKPTSAKIESHYQKYLSYVQQWENYDFFEKDIKKIIEKIDLFSNSGREGIVTSGTLIYVLLRYFKYPYLENILKTIVINRLTLKNCWKKLIKEYSFLKKYDFEIPEVGQDEVTLSIPN